MKDLSSGLGNHDALKDLQKLQQTDLNKESKTSHEGGAKFNEVFNQVHTDQAKQVEQPTNAQQTMETAKAANSQNSHEASLQRVSETKATQPDMMTGALKELMGSQNKLNDLVKLTMSGRSFQPQELLGVQTAVFMFSHQLELASKVVQQATSGLKQLMQLQV